MHTVTASKCCAGHIIAEGAGASGDLPSTVQSADWAFCIDPQDGWGPRSGKQAATAGWLASLPVFEPHWQVLVRVRRIMALQQRLPCPLKYHHCILLQDAVQDAVASDSGGSCFLSQVLALWWILRSSQAGKTTWMAMCCGRANAHTLRKAAMHACHAFRHPHMSSCACYDVM